MASRTPRGARGRSASTARQVDLGALVLDEPVDGVQDGVVLDRAGQQPGPARVGVTTGPVEALDREVVGLGATGGEQHLAGPCPSASAMGLAGLLDPRRARRPAVCREEALPTTPSSAAIAAITSGSTAWWRRGRGRPGFRAPDKSRCSPQPSASSHSSGQRRTPPTRGTARRRAGAARGQVRPQDAHEVEVVVLAGDPGSMASSARPPATHQSARWGSRPSAHGGVAPARGRAHAPYTSGRLRTRSAAHGPTQRRSEEAHPGAPRTGGR